MVDVIQPSPPILPPERRGADMTNADFAAAMLRALIDMAARSNRRQADLIASLRGARLEADPPQVRAAMRLLQQQGCITGVVPLSDGGVLLTVTRQAMEQSGPVPQWLPFDDLDDAGAASVPAT